MDDPIHIQPDPHPRPKKNGAELLTDRLVAFQRRSATGPAPPPSASRNGPKRAEKYTEDEFSRGSSSRGKLFDPVRGNPSPRRLDPAPHLPPLPQHGGRLPHAQDERRIPYTQDERRIPSSQEERRRPVRKDPSQRLFDPALHDPQQFVTRSAVPVLRRPVRAERTPEEEADRERERRKRREGSERGSHGTKRKDESRSKGSRSSEGSESLKDRERGKASDGGVGNMLRDAYKPINALEATLTEMHRKMASDPAAGISALLEKAPDAYSREIRTNKDDTAAWLELIGRHRDLQNAHRDFLDLVFKPPVPSSMHSLPVKYNIPVRLWQTGFHLLLEQLRHAWMSGHPLALDLLTDLIYDAYQFYSHLLDEPFLTTFRTAWIEALGDLARYRMAIASHLVSEAPARIRTGDGSQGDHDYDEAGLIPSSGASIGQEVAENWDVEDKETWRTTARDWYAMGITEKPGEGRLHHHLAMLCRDSKGEEGRALYHFSKSLTASHPFGSARESILPLFDSALQSQRSLPEATAMDLFVRLHGMLFTRISLDSFPSVMSRYMERLEEDASLDGVSRKARVTVVDWLMMGTVNLAAVLQYGAEDGLVRKGFSSEAAARRGKALTAEGDEEEEPPVPGPEMTSTATCSLESSIPSPIFASGLELAFAVFEFVLSHPHRVHGVHHVLNPYIPIFLTFLATVFRQPQTGYSIIPFIPWTTLVEFLNKFSPEIKEETRLVAGIPLPEDWSLRGMEWVGRRVYERGFWKGKTSISSRASGSSGPAQPRMGERIQSEMDVLEATDVFSLVDASEGVVDEVEGTDLTDGPVAINQRRWKRVAWAAGVMVRCIEGLEVSDGLVEIAPGGQLDMTLKELEVEKRKKESETIPRMAEVEDELEDLKLMENEQEDDEELSVLRERRRHLTSLLDPSPHLSTANPISKPKLSKKSQIVPGYTMLVFDTNVLLSSLAFFSKLVEGGQWSIIVPLPVVTELDGISKQPPPLGTSASQAVSYLENRIRTHSLTLKIQTSKGNYLSDLLIRTEARSMRGKTMDDLILTIAESQMQHFVDRSDILGMKDLGDVGMGQPATKVLLITFDRNLRVKARGRGVEVGDEKDLERILGK
ncbi:hypothetical protein P7C73_g4803, partial [Tremellales sp. Uapishka_1]